MPHFCALNAPLINRLGPGERGYLNVIIVTDWTKPRKLGHLAESAPVYSFNSTKYCKKIKYYIFLNYNKLEKKHLHMKIVSAVIIQSAF